VILVPTNRAQVAPAAGIVDMAWARPDHTIYFYLFFWQIPGSGTQVGRIEAHFPARLRVSVIAVAL
jgi:hypothetical protein